MNLIQVSKRLSYILRHRPESAGITLDKNGWASIDAVVNSGIDLVTLTEIVSKDEKQRYTIKDGMIRANQGHSVSVDLNLKKVIPPTVLYHGTSQDTISVILKKGILKMSRHHVHLSASREVAKQVGTRHGKPIVLSIDAKSMVVDKITFYTSDNGVWLVDYVDPKYISMK